MVKKITLLVLLTLCSLTSFSQLSIGEDEYNGFSARSFMKFNNFMTVPTFSLLHRETATIEAISRSSNIEFQDAARLHIVSYSGKMQDNVGAGIAVFQQDIGVFKDFGAMVNYAYQLKLGEKNKLTFGFNFFYSRRGIDNPRVLSNTVDPLINNYQDKPVVVLQPAATVSFGKLDVGLFFENLGDFNLKTSEFVTGFADKTISAHAAYTFDFVNTSGLLQGMRVRALGIGRRTKVDGFSYAATALADLPKVGWLKVGYDKSFGLNAGFGINLNKKLSIGFAYEKQENLSGTNEVGLIYKFGRSRLRSRRNPNVKVIIPENNPTPTIERREEEYKDPEHNDLSDEVRIAQDSINKLNRKVDEILKRLENQPTNTTTIIKEVTPETPKAQPTEDRDQSLPRRSSKPWRQSSTTTRGGGGTMYYVAFDQFRDIKKAKAEVEKLRKRKIKARYVRDPKYNVYVVYFKRFGKKEEAEELVDEVNGSGKKGFENDKTSGTSANDISSLKAATGGGKGDKGAGGNNLYVMKVTLGAEGELIKEPKSQGSARVRTMKLMDGLEPGYYLQVGVFSKKPYADRFLDELENDNINAGYFLNPKTGNRHIYIHKTDDRAEIIKLFKNNLNGAYYDRKSIIQIR
ncbi:PorP/SprF family type IX secretion system membrane protein [Tenacibaculum agarivorans]|uniref:PorP/SprF family type IX secretion system membrane protein n=1 Tax=Tenacibaculum agarivorans TaxID=1908389 RepID=UPI00094B8702|nr:PorP/SprF family type IX secretion system membrane protein [Tenacibaculum agarivorans]